MRLTSKWQNVPLLDTTPAALQAGCWMGNAAQTYGYKAIIISAHVSTPRGIRGLGQAAGSQGRFMKQPGGGHLSLSSGANSLAHRDGAALAKRWLVSWFYKNNRTSKYKS